MANPLPNEAELYERIRNEHIIVEYGIWDILYHKVGDGISAINLLCRYYLDNQQEMPVEEAEKIVAYVADIGKLIQDIVTTSKDNFPFPQLKDDIPLHPVIRELFSHYVNNDLNIITMAVSICILDKEPVPAHNIQEIVKHARAIRDFLEKLRQATLKKG